MSSATIFLSHITEEAELAHLFRKEIERKFYGLVKTFQSSDRTSITVGQNWLNSITEALRDCHAMLLFCSPSSVERQWINFECGAGWTRGIEVVPLCHSGMHPSNLPLPIRLLQGVNASAKSDLEGVFSLIAKKLGANPPPPDFDALASAIAQYEKAQKHHYEISTHLQDIKKTSRSIFSLFRAIMPNQENYFDEIAQAELERVRPSLDLLQDGGHLRYGFWINGYIAGGAGSVGRLRIYATEELINAALKLT